MFRSVKEAINDYWKVVGKVFEKRGMTKEQVAISSLPDFYNNTPCDILYKGEWYKTVGDYKAAVSKDEWD